MTGTGRARGGRILIGCALLLALAGCRCGRREAPHAGLRVGYFNNLTHGQALVAKAEGRFGPDVELITFGAGPAAMEALLSGSIDATYMGTAPAITGWVKGEHELVILAAAANGGAGLVTHRARDPEALRGTVLAAPQIGNSQDVALRYWLLRHGLEPGRDLTVVPLSNADILGLFRRGKLEGAWVPEPWASRLELQGGGTMVVDEASQWPGGRFHTTLLVTTHRALREHPAALQALVDVHLQLTREWQAAPQAFSERVLAAFTKFTGQAVASEVVARAFTRLEPAVEPELPLLQLAADHAAALKYLPPVDVTGIIDRSLLSRALATPPSPGSGGAPPDPAAPPAAHP